MKNQISKVTNNIIGALAGAGLAYLAAKKFGQSGNKIVLTAIIVAGVVVGANAQSKIKAKAGAPTAATIK